MISHFKGKYRILCEADRSTNQFSRKLDGTFEDIDCYITCQNKIQIFSYGHGILEVYIPSIGRGHNIVNAINTDLGKDIIFDKVETDGEVIFKFHAKYMDKLEKYLKPKTSGASRSPFSTKNMLKTSYSIPDEDLNKYKKIIEKIPKENILTVTHRTNDYMKSLATKKYTWEDIKADMALKGLRGKDYIHQIGKWNEYIKYLEENV